MKALVAYFSAESGRTASEAKSLAAAIGADLFAFFDCGEPKLYFF